MAAVDGRVAGLPRTSPGGGAGARGGAHSSNEGHARGRRKGSGGGRRRVEGGGGGGSHATARGGGGGREGSGGSGVNRWMAMGSYGRTACRDLGRPLRKGTERIPSVGLLVLLARRRRVGKRSRRRRGLTKRTRCGLGLVHGFTVWAHRFFKYIFSLIFEK
jgi:hypothetical protein